MKDDRSNWAWQKQVYYALNLKFRYDRDGDIIRVLLDSPSKHDLIRDLIRQAIREEEKQ